MKYQRPQSGYEGSTSLQNTDKYQKDSSSQPKVAISSMKMDGDFNYIIDALNEIDEASGSQSSIAVRLSKALNEDGSLKDAAGLVIRDWVDDSVGSILRLDNSTIQLVGDHTVNYMKNRKVRLSIDATELFAVAENVTFDGTFTEIEFVDVVDENAQAVVIDIDPTAIAYSPIVPGKTGNAVNRFVDLFTNNLELKGESPMFLLQDTMLSGKPMAIRANAGVLEFLENTGTAEAPIWNVLTQMDSAGLVLADSSIAGSKLENTGVVAGEYDFAKITVDEKGRVTQAETGQVASVAPATTSTEGTVTLATSAEMGAGDSTTKVPTVAGMKEHGGVCKVWLRTKSTNFAMANGYGVSSTTKVNSTYYWLNFTTPMPNTNYCVVGGAGQYGPQLQIGDCQTNRVAIQINGSSIGATTDTHVAIFGDYS